MGRSGNVWRFTWCPRQQNIHAASKPDTLESPVLLPISRLDGILELLRRPIRPFLHLLVLLLAENLGLGNDLGRHGLDRNMQVSKKSDRSPRHPHLTLNEHLH